LKLEYNELDLFVITGVCYSWGDLCTKSTFGTKIFVHYN